MSLLNIKAMCLTQEMNSKYKKMEEKRWKVELHAAALFIAAMVSGQGWWLYNPSTQKSEAGGWP